MRHDIGRQQASLQRPGIAFQRHSHIANMHTGTVEDASFVYDKLVVTTLMHTRRAFKKCRYFFHPQHSIHPEQ